jgi:AraC-like DNA-binding protein
MPHTFLYLWPDAFLFAAPTIQARRTRRYAAVVLLSAGRRPLWLDARPALAGDYFQGAVIAPGVRRLLTVEDGVLSLHLDPDSSACQAMVAWLAGRPLAPLAPALVKRWRHRAAALLRGEYDLEAARALMDALVQDILGNAPVPALDPRVLAVARRLRNEMPATPPLKSLAVMVGLSPGRLRHLFAAQMHMPMKAYLSWSRMRRARSLLQSGLPLTQVAAEVGFADQAHFSRSFVRYFGFTPSFLDRSPEVQVLTNSS